jgi:uncharacterized membrane protein YcjF (UPF0283 family)
MKSNVSTATSLFVLAIVLGLLQLWFNLFSAAVFVKIELTLAALLVIAVVVAFAKREQRAANENKHGGPLDL